jgi:hypothetical protein
MRVGIVFMLVTIGVGTLQYFRPVPAERVELAVVRVMF